jgi:hypothetical protein
VNHHGALVILVGIVEIRAINHQTQFGAARHAVGYSATSTPG